MASPQIEHILAEGVAAARRGQRAEARRLLEQVVEAEPRLEEAWWWLGEVVTGEARVICLENVLTLNPEHAEARALLEGLRATTQAAPSAAPEPAAEPSGPAPGAPRGLDPLDPALEDPYQCVYCGQPTRPDHERCPHCGRGLVTRERVAAHRTGWLMGAVVVVAMLAMWSGVEAFGAVLRLSLGGGPGGGLPLGLGESSLPGLAPLMDLPLARALLGDVPGMDWTMAGRVFLVDYARVALLILLALTLYLRWRWGYYATLAAVIVGLVWDLIQLLGGTTGWLAAPLGMALGAFALRLLFRSEDNFPLSVVRMRVRLHPTAVEGAGAYYWGMRYTERGQHALAVLHFRRAVARAPMSGEYHKQLGLAYARIGRYARSLKALAQARQLRPEDAQVPHIEAVVRELERQAGRAGAS